ncbi:MAG TPA: zf-HC2 domain-containing protein [Ktedonobacterales bacterium]|nr:zf-HC2 domain-containing protein [Ktedonobacterales bacterium]
MSEQQHDLATMLTCQELVELITDYQDGTLAPEERRRFDEHLAVCDACREYVAQIGLTVRALGALPPEEESAAGTQALLALFRNWKREQGLPPSGGVS